VCVLDLSAWPISLNHMNNFIELLDKRILFLDGAMGTMIQRHKLEEADYRVAVRRERQ